MGSPESDVPVIVSVNIVVGSGSPAQLAAWRRFWLIVIRRLSPDSPGVLVGECPGCRGPLFVDGGRQ